MLRPYRFPVGLFDKQAEARYFRSLNDTISLPFTVSEAQKASLTDERSDGYLTAPPTF